MTNTDGKNDLLLIVVDADALIALVNETDKLHKRAVKVSEYLVQENAALLFPTTAIAEAATKIQRVFKNPELAADLLNLVYKDEGSVFAVDSNTLKEARSLFDPSGSRKNTIFDCIVAAIAKQQKATAIFSFDKWYNKQGFKLAGEVV